jgi:hypothetical protein
MISPRQPGLCPSRYSGTLDDPGVSNYCEEAAPKNIQQSSSIRKRNQVAYHVECSTCHVQRSLCLGNSSEAQEEIKCARHRIDRDLVDRSDIKLATDERIRR